MLDSTRIAIPTLVRVKEGALDRLGVYLQRDQRRRAIELVSQGLSSLLTDRARFALREQSIEPLVWREIGDNGFETATELFVDLPKEASAVVGIGGGKALDVAKYVGFLARLPYYAVPTSLSNDGFCSPQSSLTIGSRRRSLAATLPYGVIVDTTVCRDAPRVLALSGVGDLVAKFTAIHDWKLAFHKTGEAVNDFAALLSDGSIHAFLAHPEFDPHGMRLLATSLMLNGIAMEVSGSSRPASGSEHLISHALDAISSRPRLHGMQVGVATYLVSLLQQANSSQIAGLFEATGFWQAVQADPFSRQEWLEAVRMAPCIKPGYHTILTERDVQPEVERLLTRDRFLANCFA